NMTSDANKGITTIGYNHLNLPDEIVTGSGTISYVYDALGTKLQKTVSGEGSVTQYAGNHIYSGNTMAQTLQFFSTPEGYVTPDGISGYDHVYQYRDHLGNIRFSYTDAPSNPGTPTIIEENSYYPFGLEHKGYNNVVNGVENKYKTYQGKEIEEDLGLNTLAFGWRDYDPAIARFNKIDRFAEKYEDLTPYHFTANNPLTYLEINGDSLDVANDRSSKRDIRNLVRGRNRRYLSIDDNGNVSLDFSKLRKNETVASILAGDEGLSLVSDLVNSNKEFLYESSEVLLARDQAGNKARGEMFRDPNGVVNASEYGLDSSGKLTIRPRAGYDGQVVIAPRVSHYEADSKGNEVRKSRSSIVFHELGENYERTHNGVNYSGASGAHQLSINRESNFYRKSNMPGQVTKIVNPKPSKSTRKKYVKRMAGY